MHMKRQAGFTLIEISIVLMIIGLILGAVMLSENGGISNTKTTGTISLIKNLSAAMTDFKNRYHYLPGDMPEARGEMPDLSAACNIAQSTPGIGNGLIDKASEQGCVAEQLVLAGLIKGDFAGIMSPYNGGQLPDVFVIAASQGALAFSASVQNVIEIRKIPCEAAKVIDRKIDDGDVNTGDIRSRCTKSLAVLDVAL